MWVVASLRRDAERACDDRVLLAGTPAPEYARHLVEAARGRPASWLLTASAGAEGSHLGNRVVALLEDRDRRVPTRRSKALLGGCALLALAVLATVQPVAAGGGAGTEDQASVAPAPHSKIVHEPYGCLIEGRYPKIDATIDPAPEITEARLYFTSAMVEEGIEYWIAMTLQEGRFVGRLPKPREAASPVRYRIKIRRSDGGTATTERYSAVVAADESSCPANQRIAPAATSTEAVTVHAPPSIGE